MLIVIQCAARKRSNAGTLVDNSGKSILFVADPDAAPPTQDYRYFHPDDDNADGRSWRMKLLEYNNTRQNPFGLLPAYQLYENETYRRLVQRFGLKRVFILSAGWGLIPAHFLTPKYDITFSPSADAYKRRKHRRYDDFRMLPTKSAEPVLFFGGKDYLPLFCELTSAISAPKIVFYNSASSPRLPGCYLQKFETRTRTNWHYECANAFLADRIEISPIAPSSTP